MSCDTGQLILCLDRCQLNAVNPKLLGEGKALGTSLLQIDISHGFI